MNKISEIVLATTNKGKLAELKSMFENCPVNIKGLIDFSELEDVEETGATFAENALIKAEYYSKMLDRLVLADDSGLQVDALNGAPGVYSARYAGVTGENRDSANNKKLLDALKDLPPEKRTARFRCNLCLSSPEKVVLEIDGAVEGIIINEPRGDNGFGYDPIFYVPEQGMTAAEMPPKLKNSVSHRGRALKRMLDLLLPALKDNG